MASKDGGYAWIIGAGLGFAFGGPIGAIIGGVIGSKLKGGMALGKGRIPYEESGRNRGHYTGGGEDGDLILSFLVLAAAVVKADGEVRSSEITTFKRYVVNSFGSSKGAALMKLFQEVLQKPIDIPKVCAQINNAGDDTFKRTVLQILFEVAFADSEYHQSERDLIHTIAQKLKISDSEFNSISAMYEDRTASKSSVDNRDFKILEVDSNSSAEEIKKQYRVLVKKYHPDKVSHLGNEFKELAEKKFKEINEAYERISKNRKMN